MGDRPLRSILNVPTPSDANTNTNPNPKSTDMPSNNTLCKWLEELRFFVTSNSPDRSMTLMTATPRWKSTSAHACRMSRALEDEQDEDKRLHRHRLTAAVPALHPRQLGKDLAHSSSKRDRHGSKQGQWEPSSLFFVCV
jgi:hypothetical protein